MTRERFLEYLRTSLVELKRIRLALLLLICSSLLYGIQTSLQTIAFIGLFISFFIILCFIVSKELFNKYSWDVGYRLNSLYNLQTVPKHRLYIAIAMLFARLLIYISILLSLTFLTSFLLRGSAFGADPCTLLTIIEEESAIVWKDVNKYHILGQIKAESNFKETAIRVEPSGVVSYGLMQVLDVTLADMKKKHKLLTDIEPVKMLQAKYSIRAGLIYDYDMWKLCWFAVDELNRYAFMFSAYNGGYGWLLRDRRLTEQYGYNKNIWFGNVEKFSNRNQLAFKINREYPVRIFKYSKWFEGGGNCKNQ